MKHIFPNEQIKKVMAPVTTKERDYLEQDAPLRGQNYVCLSFLSPEDAIASKDAFAAGKFSDRLSEEFSQFLTALEDIVSTANVSAVAADVSAGAAYKEVSAVAADISAGAADEEVSAGAADDISAGADEEVSAGAADDVSADAADVSAGAADVSAGAAEDVSAGAADVPTGAANVSACAADASAGADDKDVPAGAADASAGAADEVSAGAAADEVSAGADEKVSASMRGRLAALRERYAYMLSGESMRREYDAFMAANASAIAKEYSEKSDGVACVRGIKVRGCYDTMSEARHRCETLKRADPNFSVYVAEVGCWCPWSPSPDELAAAAGDQNVAQYSETALNTLMQKYQENAEERDQFYNERKRMLMASSSGPSSVAAASSADGEAATPDHDARREIMAKLEAAGGISV